MTTIVYNHKDRQIACDMREVAGNEIKSESINKWIDKDGKIYFLSGCCHDMQLFVDADKSIGFKPEKEIECTAIIVDGEKVTKGSYDKDIGYWEVELTYNDSIGSGAVYGLCAMDFGKSARESIEYAHSRDIYTGKSAKVYEIDSGLFQPNAN